MILRPLSALGILLSAFVGLGVPSFLGNRVLSGIFIVNALVVLGFGLALGGMWQLKGVENIDHLVTTGLFSRIRHPMYVGFILWILGWSAYQGAVATSALGVLGVLSVLWWRHLEEKSLWSSYGSVYAEYERDVVLNLGRVVAVAHAHDFPHNRKPNIRRKTR
jgi:protein-S-isoprenylcysteine O-methyltransferase Ste14